MLGTERSLNEVEKSTTERNRTEVYSRQGSRTGAEVGTPLYFFSRLLKGEESHGHDEPPSR